MKWYKNFDKNKDFFAYLHVDDIHFREMFFTHDTKNMEILDEDFNNVENYLKSLPKNYKGSLSYDLSVMYVDKQIEKIFNFLEEENLLETTDVIITADHGNSYTYKNIRENYVNNFYQENYHVPCIIYSKKNKLNINQNNFYQTKDIPATILEMQKLKVPKSYSGQSMINFKGRDYVIAQYIGSGCPDIINRTIKLNVRTKNYSISGECMMNDLSTLEIHEIYDIKKDPNENINILNNINLSTVNKEIEIMKKTILDLQQTNKKIIKESMNKNNENK